MGDKADRKIDNQADDKTADEASIEAVIAKSANTTADKDEKPVVNASKGGFMMYLVALMILLAAIIGGLTLTGQLQPLYESLMASKSDTTIVQQSDKMAALQADQLSMNPSLFVPTDKMPAVVHPRVADSYPELETGMPAASEQSAPPSVQRSNGNGLNDLLFSIDSLRTALWRMEESQQILKQSLVEQQQMNLQVRLRWIADSDSRLPQMQLAWEEISLLPGLNEQQRQQAVEMHALARANVQRLKKWQASLHKWAEALTTPIHENVLPQPEHAWLAWIVGQFQLRQAPSQEARTLADLRGRLLDAARQLTLQAWPNQAAWQRLHAELLLQVTAMQADGDEIAVETDLPVDFAGIQIDISMLRQTAEQWVSDAQQRDVQPDDFEHGDIRQGGML